MDKAIEVVPEFRNRISLFTQKLRLAQYSDPIPSSRHLQTRLSLGPGPDDIKHHIVSHLCACGCGQRIDTPIDPDEWRLTYDGESISLWPSIGNYDSPCHSHYFIINNIAVPVGTQPYHKKKKKKRWWLFGLF